MEVVVTEEKKKIFRARKTMKISDRQQLESLHSTLTVATPSSSEASPPPLVNGTHKEDGPKMGDKELNSISDSSTTHVPSPSSLNSPSSPVPFLSLNLSPSPASSQSQEPTSPLDSLKFELKKLGEDEEGEKKSSSAVSSNETAAPASTESKENQQKDTEEKEKKQGEQTTAKDTATTTVSVKGLAPCSSVPLPESDCIEPMDTDNDTKDSEAFSAKIKEEKPAAPKSATSDSSLPYSPSSRSTSSSGTEVKQEKEIKEEKEKDVAKKGLTVDAKMEVDVKVEAKKEKSEVGQSAKPARPSSTPPSNTVQEDKGSTSGLKRTLSDGSEKAIIDRKGKKPKLQREELEAQLELKITSDSTQQPKLEKIVQQLVEERLKALQSAIFDKHFEELKTRVDKIECAAKHQTAINTIQAKIARLSKKFGEANQASENKRKQEALAAAAAAATAAATVAAAAKTAAVPNSAQAQRPVRTSMEGKQAPTTVSSSTAARDAAEEKERRGHKEKKKQHKELTLEKLNKSEDKKDETNKRKSTKWAVKVLREFLADKNLDVNFERYTAPTLNDKLRLFYASVQSKEGGRSSITRLRALRDGINRYLRDKDIISDAAFKTSNAVFTAMLKRYQKSAKDASIHHRRISESDLEKIRCSSVLSPDTPLGLVRKVWFDIQLSLLWHGRNKNRELTMASFVVQKDKNGVEYVSLVPNPCTKKHNDPDNPPKESRNVMLARPGDPLCPVKSFFKYISKRPPGAKSFYLHPKHPISLASDVWYSTEPMGIQYLGHMLNKISKEVGLPWVYSNHCLRSTAQGLL